MLALILTLMMNAPSRLAHSARDFCARHLVANDPWPHAEEPTDLLDVFAKNKSDDVKRELEFRVANGMLSDEELAKLVKGDMNEPRASRENGVDSANLE